MQEVSALKKKDKRKRKRCLCTKSPRQYGTNLFDAAATSIASELGERMVQVITDVLVFLLLMNQFICKDNKQ